jgi:hypothetical protein
MEFPRLVYRCPGPFPRAGGTYGTKPVNTEAEFDSAVADGWFDTLPDAIEGKPPVPVVPADDAPPTRDELEAKARELGIKFDGRTTDKKLSAAIDEPLKA